MAAIRPAMLELAPERVWLPPPSATPAPVLMMKSVVLPLLLTEKSPVSVVPAPVSDPCPVAGAPTPVVRVTALWFAIVGATPLPV